MGTHDGFARAPFSRAPDDPRRRWVLGMHIRLASVRDVDWVAARFGHA